MISVADPATPEENQYIQSFFKTLKRAEVYVKQYETIDDGLDKLPKFIDEIFNGKRFTLRSDIYRRPNLKEKL